MARLVDSRDIVELQLKQSDCELMIRKKEALQPPPATAMPQPSQPFYYPTLPSPQLTPTAAASAPAISPPSKATPALPSPTKSASSHPPLKCPMAGTFYRCPGPGEPPFVKVCEHTYLWTCDTWLYSFNAINYVYQMCCYHLNCLRCLCVKISFTLR